MLVYQRVGIPTNVGKTAINHPIFDGLHHPWKSYGDLGDGLSLF